MQSATIVQRTLEIDAVSDPLSGRLTSHDQPERRFRGWLELFAVIEELRVAPDTAARSDNVDPGSPGHEPLRASKHWAHGKSAL
jgi:hypothetical protein